MVRSTAGTALSFGAVLLLGTALSSGAAYAGSINCTGGTITVPGGVGQVLDSALGANVCVQTVDKVWGNFNLGTLSGGSLQFTLNNDPDAHHGMAFNNSYQTGNTYTVSFSVEVQGSSNLITELDGDFTQSDGGPSTLVKTTTQAPSSGSINFSKTGNVELGPNQMLYGTGVTQLDVTDVLTDNGSISSILDTVVENAPAPPPPPGVPEPASLVLLGTALVGLGTLRRRKSA